MRDRLVLASTAASDPEVGRWLSAMEDARRRTMASLDEASDAVVDWVPMAGGNSIGTVLYHVAAIEADWLFSEILGPDAGRPWPAELFPFDVRDKEGQLTAVSGLSLKEHVDRLQRTRAILLECLREMAPEEFHRVRALEEYDVAPAWVLHHLMQHEAEHRAQISSLRAAAEGRQELPT